MTNDTSPKKHTDLSTLIQTALKHHQNGDLLSAEKIYRHILLMDANQLDANHLYGVLICQAGKFGAAIPFLEKAVQIKPDFAEAYNNLGFAYQNLGKLEEALACFKKAIELLPKYPDALNNYGMVLIKLGRLHEAISYHQKAIELKPDFIQAYCNLGALFNKLNQPKTAIDYLDKALNLNSNYADAYYNIAFAWLKMGSTEKCVKALRQTIKLIPNNPFYHNELATVLRESGRIDDAAESYRNALKIDPNYIQAHKNLALIVKHNVYNEEIQKMEKMYFSPSLSQDDKIHLGVGLSKVYEDLELFEKSFQFIVEANNIKRKTYNYSIQKEKLFFKRIINSFNSKFFNRSEIKGRPDKSPVFIVGMPRSGTTLVEQIIASHKSVHGAGELPYFSSLTQSLFRKLNSAQIQDGLNDLSTTDFYSIGTKYIEQTKLFSNDALYITDKLPHNFLQIGMIYKVFPKAKIIHCQRNPLDNCLSIYKTHFIDAHKYSYDMVELGEYYRLYEKLMKHWRKQIPGYIYDLNYEDLVTDTEKTARDILDWIGLPWDENCLMFYKTKRLVKTASAAQVVQPIYKHSIHRWQLYGNLLTPLKQALECS